MIYSCFFVTYKEACCFIYPGNIKNVKSRLSSLFWKTSWTYKTIAKIASYPLMEDQSLQLEMEVFPNYFSAI